MMILITGMASRPHSPAAVTPPRGAVSAARRQVHLGDPAAVTVYARSFPIVPEWT